MTRSAIMLGVDDSGVFVVLRTGHAILSSAELTALLHTLVAAQQWTAAGWRRARKAA